MRCSALGALVNHFRHKTNIAIGAAALVALLLLLSPRQAFAQPRPWDLSARVFAEYDTNVPLVSDESDNDVDEESLGAGVYLSGAYRFVQDDPWEAGVRGGVTLTGYLEDDDNDFNLVSIAPTFYGNYDFTLANDYAATAEASYIFYKDWLQGDNFLTRHGPQAELIVHITPGFQANAHYRILFDNFHGDPDSDNERDAIQHGLGFGGSYAFNAGRQSVSAGYEFIHNDADGDNFVYNAHSLSGEFFTVIAGPVAGALQAGYEMQDYPDFVGEDREMDNLFGRVVIFIAIAPNISVDVYLSHNIYDSNLDAFEADRTTIGGGLTYRFP